MIRFLISKPIATCIIFFAFIVLGFITFNSIPIAMLPNVAIPEITVYAYQKDYTAREMQDRITSRLCQQFRQCQNIENIVSRTTDGKSAISIRFDYGTNIDYASMEVNERLDNATGWLPRGMERPKVIKANVSDIPVFYLNISYNASTKSIQENFLHLSELTQKNFKKQIEYIPEVAFVDITGVDIPQIVIKPDRMKLQTLGLNLNDIQSAFEQNNVQYGNIEINQGLYHYNIRLEAKLLNKREIENILIKTTNRIDNHQFRNTDRIIKLKDIAEVSVETKTKQGIFVSNNKQAISLAIIKQPKAKISVLKEKVKQTLNTLKQENKGINFELAQDQTKLLDDSISNLKQDLIIGSILAILVVFLFYNNLKEPLLIGLSVPLSLMITLFFFWFFNLTINIISLSGLILAIGMMTDNAIIVVDNITQQWHKKKNLLEAGVSGTNQIIAPLLSSILTTIAVFVPLIFVSGIAGGLFKDNALAVSIGLAVSFWVSIILLPVGHNILFNKKNNNSEQSYVPKVEGILYKPLESFYNKGFHTIFKYKYISLLILLVLIIGSCFIFRAIKKESFPQVPEKDFFAIIDWNEGISPNTAKERITNAINCNDAQINKTSYWIGIQDYSLSTNYDLTPTQAKLYFEVDTPSSIHFVQTKILKKFNHLYPNASIKFEKSSNIFNQIFENNENEVELQIFPQSTTMGYDSISRIIDQFQELSEQNDSTVKIPSTEFYSIELINEKILLYDLTKNSVINILLSAFDNYNIGNLNTTANTIPVYIGNQKESIEKFINNYVIKGLKGREIPLKELVRVRTKTDIRYIQSNVDGEYLAYPLNSKIDIKEIKQKIDLKMRSISPTLKYHVGGGYEKTNNILNELIIVVIISIILLYFILAAQFESLMLPLIILIEIPIDICFAIWVLYLTGNTLNIMSVIGLIVMSGIVINDSILKIDAINSLRKKENISLLDAIHEGGISRLRPIAMTTLTTVLALIPTLFSSSFGTALQKPFAITIIASLVFGTIISLFLIPLLYWIFLRKKHK